MKNIFLKIKFCKFLSIINKKTIVKNILDKLYIETYIHNLHIFIKIFPDKILIIY